jgi:subtilisin family serine protease
MAQIVFLQESFIRQNPTDWQQRAAVGAPPHRVLPRLGALYIESDVEFVKNVAMFDRTIERRIVDAKMLSSSCGTSTMRRSAKTNHLIDCNATAWHKKKRFGAGINVGILDSGVIAHEPEFGGRNLAAEFQEFDERGPVAGAPRDITGHGTGEASLVAGAKSGVAPAAGMRHALMFGPDGRSVNTHTVCWAVDWCMKDCRIALAAWEAVDQDIAAVLKRAYQPPIGDGMLIVGAIGNIEGSTSMPGNLSFVLGVGAMRSNTQPWPCSGSNSDKPDLSAPGEDITAAWIEEDDRQYVTASGTSMAAAITAGAAALVAEKNPKVTKATDLRDLMLLATQPNKNKGTGGRSLWLPKK